MTSPVIQFCLWESLWLCVTFQCVCVCVCVLWVYVSVCVLCSTLFYLLLLIGVQEPSISHSWPAQRSGYWIWCRLLRITGDQLCCVVVTDVEVQCGDSKERKENFKSLVVACQVLLQVYFSPKSLLCLCVCACLQVCTCVSVCMCVCVCLCLCLCLCEHVCVHINTYYIVLHRKLYQLLCLRNIWKLTHWRQLV